ncbi:unnamed protein product [Nippostrongylus brasiliensis]|uniref:Bestrophin homolog n=1 Tax=Nippostrongylus brasiliensis TaxID=27835 RepID=A0A158R0N8_NIPBR|nr:unnamed protein product [Nippostrongylus brasiliensis]
MTFLRLLLLWRGSVWKHVLFELLLWSLGCISLAMVYLTFIKEGSPDHGDYCKMLAHLQELPFKLTPQKARIVRHSVYRYLLLVYILVLRDVSIPVKNQFPTYNHLIEGNLLTEEELDLMEHANIDPNYCRYWIPMLWVAQVIKKQYSIGLGPIAFFIMPELVTQQRQSLVQSMVFAVNTIANFVFTFVTLPTYTHIHVSGQEVFG